MEWFSIREYKPPTAADLFIRLESSSGHYERYIVACCENINDSHDPEAWELVNVKELDVSLKDYRVTHFAIPAPVLIG